MAIRDAAEREHVFPRSKQLDPKLRIIPSIRRSRIKPDEELEKVAQAITVGIALGPIHLTSWRSAVVVGIKSMGNLPPIGQIVFVSVLTLRNRWLQRDDNVPLSARDNHTTLHFATFYFKSIGAREDICPAITPELLTAARFHPFQSQVLCPRLAETQSEILDRSIGLDLDRDLTLLWGRRKDGGQELYPRLASSIGRRRLHYVEERPSWPCSTNQSSRLQ